MLPDEAILSITSPQDHVNGPYAVIYKNEEELWAVVALDWDKAPTLGVRWFSPPSEDQTKGGNPTSRNFPTWLIVPGPLHKAILAGLPLNVPTYDHVLQFLTGAISGEELQEAIPAT